MKESCCSFRRISRTRKIVLTTTPAMMTRKKIEPKTIRTPSRQLISSQPMFRVTAAATRQIPRMVKKIALRLRPEIITYPYEDKSFSREGDDVGGGQAGAWSCRKSGGGAVQHELSPRHAGGRLEVPGPPDARNVDVLQKRRVVRRIEGAHVEDRAADWDDGGRKGARERGIAVGHE